MRNLLIHDTLNKSSRLSDKLNIESTKDPCLDIARNLIYDPTTPRPYIIVYLKWQNDTGIFKSRLLCLSQMRSASLQRSKILDFTTLQTN